jgi:hypothetical protein
LVLHGEGTQHVTLEAQVVVAERIQVVEVADELFE